MSEVIASVKDNQEKYETYRSQVGRYNLAMKHGFYLEALLIDYAVLEDRLSAFLWGAGVMNDMDNFKIGNRRNKALLQQIYTAYSGSETMPRLKNISGKIEMVRALLVFAESDYDGDNRYLSALYEGLLSLNREELSDSLIGLDTWRGYRNEVIHAAMSKNVYSLQEHLAENAALGMEYARIIDNASKKLNRRTTIRKRASMPIVK
ncbi:MAG: hypothetical protein K5695_00070 [Oscillospiraceae bacterium]|nr:hypothetical protein [Oscillospiraceae bacterium]